MLRRRAIIDAVRNTIDRAISTRPTVLLLEDLHWIDGQSETAIEALMSLTANRPLLVLTENETCIEGSVLVSEILRLTAFAFCCTISRPKPLAV